MNRLLLLFCCFGLFIFGCDKSKQTTKNESTTSEEIKDESVEIGAGTEISPQVEGIKDSATRLEVDTINSPQEAHEREK